MENTENVNTEATETPEAKIVRLESEVEKSRNSILAEMNARASRCADEIRIMQAQILQKHNCKTDGTNVIANAF